MANIITFYSYKGGVGRSMALANIACLLAKSGKRVLMIDWDLEAPGLHKYFKSYLQSSHTEHEGLIDFFKQARKTLGKIPFHSDTGYKIRDFLGSLQNYIQTVFDDGTLFILQAGKLDNNYGKNVNGFNWETFFKRIPDFFTYFVEYLNENYDYVLIDSRTGYTDMGGICTMLMPDKLVLIFAPNQQNIEGLLQVGKKAMDYRNKEAFDDSRPLRLYPLPSRIELQEQQLRQDWESEYKRQFEKFYGDIYQLNNLNLDKYFGNIKIPHFSFYAYGEEIATMRENPLAADSLANAYYRFRIQLEAQESIWELQKIYFTIHCIYSDTQIQEYQQLTKHLSPLEKGGYIKPINPITPYQQWDITTERLMAEALEQARTNELICYLLSPDLINTEWFKKIKSDNCLVLLPPTNNSNISKSELRNLRDKNITVLASFVSDTDDAWFNIIEKMREYLELLSYKKK
jgi:MinD-like ATPase involved in chromosome partitioning or flagellar assembly